MTLNQLNDYFNSFLKKENYSFDPSRNGIQIQNSEPDSKQIKKIAFAVDACEESAKLAAENNADVLFVHHGLFWGDCQPITGNFYSRIAQFIKNDLALCAYHIPLDANNPYGNNYGLAKRIDLTELEEFGQWRGMNIGVKGKLSVPATIECLAEKVLNKGEKPSIILPFGKKEISTVGIISGGAGEDVEQAIEQNLDLYITGEVNHELFHYIKENKINVIAGGHYQTETVGVNLIKQKVNLELGQKENIETIFIDIPTGL